MLDLNKDVKYVKGVGPSRVQLLNKVGIFTLKDLITYFPRDYEDRSKPKEIYQCADGEEALIEADEYKSIEQIRVKNHPLWNYLRKNNLFKVAKPTDLMFRRVKTVEEAWEISQYYKSIADLSNHASKAYRLLRDAGLLQKRYPKSVRKAVLQYSLDGKLIREWPNATVASHGLGMNINGYIGLVCKGKKKSAGGFLWKYKEDIENNDKKI